MSIPPEDQALFDDLKAGKYYRIDEVYTRYRQPFVAYAHRQLFATEADAEDCFQETVIAFYRNIATGQLTELTCKIVTYLYSIGSRITYRNNRRRQRERPTDHETIAHTGDDPGDELDWSLIQRIDDDHRKAKLLAAIDRIGEPCREILTLRFYHNYAVESITTALDLPSDGATRIKQMRCLKKLKELIGP